MQALFSFLKSKQFFVHFGLIIGTVLLFFFILVKFLSSYTGHGDYVEVPDFKNIGIHELDNFIKDKEINYQIIDSIYDPKQKTGIVLRQDPEANSKVKHNRTIYLYVTGMVAPQIQMPKLVDRSERQAKLIIETYGLKMGSVKTKAADCNGCVIEQMANGKVIAPGEAVKKGSVISLIVGVKDNGYVPAANDTSDNGYNEVDKLINGSD